MKKITLDLKEDEATGIIGFIPSTCEEFNSFTDAIGLFHDVFEHWFENHHKYFKNEYACDRSGELEWEIKRSDYKDCVFEDYTSQKRALQILKSIEKAKKK